MDGLHQHAKVVSVRFACAATPGFKEFFSTDVRILKIS